MYDAQVVFWWWIVLLSLGWVGWPITRRLFSRWEDGGYLFSKIIGLSLATYIIWILGFTKLLPFTWGTSFLACGTVLGVGIVLSRKRSHSLAHPNWKVLVVQEILFLVLLYFWSWIKGHEPTINGLEKFMDYGFTQSILQGSYFPPVDMWFAGGNINYYYFGHLMMAVLTRLSGMDLGFTFNLMLATLFAWCGSMSFAIGKQLFSYLPTINKWLAGLFIAFLVTMGGNLQTIYAFTSGYTGDYPPPFWNILSSWKNFETGWKAYWYPNATRFIPFTIHEFPSYSFVVSDIHGHVLSIPLALLAIALMVNTYVVKKEMAIEDAIIFGLVSGALFMTNALDGPIYLGLFIFTFILMNKKIEWENWNWWKEKLVMMGIVVVSFVVSVIPFLISFKPFVSGVAVNCPPSFLAEGKLGPLLFETVDKCQRSPIWMLLVLWGFFFYCGLWLVRVKLKPEDEILKRWLLIVSLFCLGLIIFPEIFYFKDIYPQHFRSNTMFKLGYQAFMMLAIMSGYVICKALERFRKHILGLVLVIPLLALVSIYPKFSVNSYFGNLKNYQGIYGNRWLETRYPNDYLGIRWLNDSVPDGEQPVVLEANGDSYTDYNRVSVFTGLPTVAGWLVHEWLWRGGYEPIANRAEEVKLVYESHDDLEAKAILEKYQVRYVFVGDLERQKYQNIQEEKFSRLGKMVFQSGETKIYEITSSLGV